MNTTKGIILAGGKATRLHPEIFNWVSQDVKLCYYPPNSRANNLDSDKKRNL